VSARGWRPREHKLCTEAGFVLREEAGFRALLGKEAKEEGKDHGCAPAHFSGHTLVATCTHGMFPCSLAPAAADLHSGMAGACTAVHCSRTTTTSTATCTRSTATSALSERVCVLCLSTQVVFLHAQSACMPPALGTAGPGTAAHCCSTPTTSMAICTRSTATSAQLAFMRAQCAPPACQRAPALQGRAPPHTAV